MKNMLVAQSGGPSAAINATITGVIDAGIASDQVGHVYGARNGIKGVLNENFVKGAVRILSCFPINLSNT